MPPLRPGNCVRICRPSRSRSASSPPPGRRLDDLDRPDRPADPADALEPGVAGEIMAAGQRHRRRRLEPRLERGSAAPSPSPGARIVLRQGNAHQRRQVPAVRVARVSRRSPLAARVSTRSTLASNADDRRPFEPWARPPTRCATRSARSPQPWPVPPNSSARPIRPCPTAEPGSRHPEANDNEWPPTHRGPGSHSQAAIPAPKAAVNHKRQLRPLTLEKGLDPRRQTAPKFRRAKSVDAPVPAARPL